MDKIGLGKKGEDIVAKYLISKGYSIVTRNYRTQYGEIDIIASKDRILTFVEVKTRRSKKFGQASEAVDYHKQSKIINTSLMFLSENTYNLQVRYDVVEVYILNKKIEINHFENAFNFQ